METIKGTEELREQLAAFEQDIAVSIASELGRIGRTVQIAELDYIPFNENVRDYVVAIRLDNDNSPVLDTSFNDVKEKYLSSFISDGEIDHWSMIAFLGMLQDIEN
jgi:hypothetical protein